MFTSKSLALAALLAFVEARFGQEQIPVAAVQALGDAGFGDPGVAATIAGSIPGSLLAAANPCQKLSIADQIIDELGTDQQVVDAAIGLVAAETNFNPFAVNKPFVCAEASLPVNAQLRGIVPLVDPAVDGSDVENANSELSIGAPFDANGLSQAEVMITRGFNNFTAVTLDGQNIVLPGQVGAAQGGGGGAGAGNGNGNDDTQDDAEDDAEDDGAVDQPVDCGNAGNDDADDDADDGADDDVDDGQDDGQDNGQDDAPGTGSDIDTSNLDFGLCEPTMARIGGLNNRPADEFTFIPKDPLCAQGQQEALNPNIITNRICDQLTNVCEANDAAKAACLEAKAQIEALGTRDQSTADTWNALLGFAGADSSVQGV